MIASGNNGSSVGIAAPACISTAIAVGSTTKADAVSSFSNRCVLPWCKHRHAAVEHSRELPVRVACVADQDAGSLRVLEQSALMPGQSIIVVARHPVADSVSVEGAATRQIGLGARAASKVLVDVPTDG